MDAKRTKATGAVIGSALLLGSIGAGTVGALAHADGAPPAGGLPASVQPAPEGTVVRDAVVAVRDVQGAFSFTQDQVTPTSVIASVFNQAVRSLCAAQPADEALDGRVVTIGGPAADVTFSGMVPELAQDEGAVTYVVACSCAANAPGGGAIANAEVSGVSLRSLAERAQAL